MQRRQALTWERLSQGAGSGFFEELPTGWQPLTGVSRSVLGIWKRGAGIKQVIDPALLQRSPNARQ